MPRPAGTPNKLTQGARHAIFDVFEKIGGVASFAEWASENKQEFYRLWGKTIPQWQQISGLNGEAIKTESVMPEQDKSLMQAYLNQRGKE